MADVTTSTLPFSAFVKKCNVTLATLATLPELYYVNNTVQLKRVTYPVDYTVTHVNYENGGETRFVTYAVIDPTFLENYPHENYFKGRKIPIQYSTLKVTHSVVRGRGRLTYTVENINVQRKFVYLHGKRVPIVSQKVEIKNVSESMVGFYNKVIREKLKENNLITLLYLWSTSTLHNVPLELIAEIALEAKLIDKVSHLY
jgi:hypothetical protein